MSTRPIKIDFFSESLNFSSGPDSSIQDIGKKPSRTILFRCLTRLRFLVKMKSPPVAGFPNCTSSRFIVKKLYRTVPIEPYIILSMSLWSGAGQ